MTTYSETATCWHLLTRTYGGTVSMVKNLDAPTARQAYQRLRPNTRPERILFENAGGGCWFEGGSSVSDGSISAVDILGPEGCELDPWRGVEPLYARVIQGRKMSITAAEYEAGKAKEGGDVFGSVHAGHGAGTAGAKPFVYRHNPMTTQSTTGLVGRYLLVKRDRYNELIAANNALSTQDTTIAELVAALEKADEALAPSGDTKAAYMGEFSFHITETAFDEDAEEFVENQRKVYVPWDTIKEIMVAIRQRALTKARSAL